MKKSRRLSKKVNLIEGTDYCLIQDPVDADGFLVKIMRGQFIGTVVGFDAIKIREAEDQSNASIDFKYSIIVSPAEIEKNQNIMLEGFLSHILYDIIINSDSDSIIYTDSNGNQLRDYDPPKPSSE